jgi:hypothetical protein
VGEHRVGPDLRSTRFAYDDGPRRLEPGGDRAVLVGDVVGQARQSTPRRTHTGGGMAILQGDRHAVECAPRPFPCERVVGLSGAPSRTVFVEGHDGVQTRVVPLDVGEVRIHDSLTKRPPGVGSPWPTRAQERRSDRPWPTPPTFKRLLAPPTRVSFPPTDMMSPTRVRCTRTPRMGEGFREHLNANFGEPPQDEVSQNKPSTHSGE